MSKYVEDFSDVNVEGIEFYVKEEPDGYLYKEATFENKISSAELKHTFEMGDLIIVDGNYKYRPEVFGEQDGNSIAVYDKASIESNVLTLTPTLVSSFDPELITDVEIGASEDLLGKVISDLQEDVEILEDKITGTLKYVTGYTGFSSDPELQEGNYLAIHNISNLDDPIIVELICGFYVPTTLDADGIIILKIANTNQKVKVTCGDLVKEYSLEDMILLSE